MQDGHSNLSYTSVSRILLLPSTFLSLLAVLPGNAIAQSTATTSLPLLTSKPTPSAATSLPPRTSHTRPIVTSFLAANTSDATTPTTVTSTDPPVANDILPGSGRSNQDPNQGVFHYYWLILALFGVLVAAFLWWINRRRRRRKEQMRLNGQDALARDMEGWTNTRRWFHGAWRPDQMRQFAPREEGLDEHGEAPPPYRPKADVTGAQNAPQHLVGGLSMPLRTFSREGVDSGRPPEYWETTNRGLVTAGSYATQPRTAGASPEPSVRNSPPQQS